MILLTDIYAYLIYVFVHLPTYIDQTLKKLSYLGNKQLYIILIGKKISLETNRGLASKVWNKAGSYI